MNIALSKAYAIIDRERRKFLKRRLQWAKGTEQYSECSGYLRLLNYLKKGFQSMTQTYYSEISPADREGFIQRYRMLKRAWLEADGDTEKSDNIILDLFNEIEDLLQFPMGN